MGIDLVVTTLWAELSTWSASATEVILEPRYWAIHGATRMGKALTFEDRLDETEIGAAALAAGVDRARGVMALLSTANRSTVAWDEPLPPPVRTNHEAEAALEASFVRDVYGDAVDRLHTLAHALQGGATLSPDASFEEVRVAFSKTPRSGPRPSGPFSALLAMGLNTLWVPTALASVWDSPAFVIGSSLQLASDLAALPVCLRETDPDLAGDLADLALLVEDLEAALRSAGSTRCVAMSG